MGRQSRTRSEGGGPLSSAAAQWGVLAALVALAAFGAVQGRKIARIEAAAGQAKGADARLAQLESRVEALAKSQPPPQRRGPDPAKVYTVNTAGAPSRGAGSAPIVIAEFSDYQ